MKASCALTLLVGFVIGFGLKKLLQGRCQELRHEDEDERLAQWADSHPRRPSDYDPEAHEW